MPIKVSKEWLEDAIAKGVVVEGKKVNLAAINGPVAKKSKADKDKFLDPWAVRRERTDGRIEIGLMIPLRLKPATNGGTIKKWMIGIAGQHRRAVTRRLASCIHLSWPFVAMAQDREPIECRIIRHGRTMDDDNLAACCKQVRDAIALYLGVDDGPTGPVRWSYAQRSSSAYGCQIEMIAGKPRLRSPSDSAVRESGEGRS